MFREALPSTKIQIELTTKGENTYRVTFRVEGKSAAEVAAAVNKELKRRHWIVNCKGAQVFVRGFSNEEDERENVTGLKVMLVTSDPFKPPLAPRLGGAGNVNLQVLIQFEPLSVKGKK